VFMSRMATHIVSYRMLKGCQRPCLGQGASMGEEAVFAASGRAGEKAGLFDHPLVELL